MKARRRTGKRLHVHAAALVWSPYCLDRCEQTADELGGSRLEAISLWLRIMESL